MSLAVFAAALASLGSLAASAAANFSASDSQDLQFNVQLFTQKYPQGLPGDHYAYLDDYFSHGTDWTPLVGGSAGAPFNFLQTAQFVLQPDDQPVQLTVTDYRGGADCAALLWTNQHLPFALGTLGLPLGDLPAPTVDQPLHATIAPFRGGSTCELSGVFESARAIALWISRASSDPQPQFGEKCHFSVGGDAFGNGCLQYPSWEFVPAYQGKPAYMTLKGSLVPLILESQRSGEPIPTITIDQGVDLNYIPVNNMVVRFEVQPGCEVACASGLYDTCYVQNAESLVLDAGQPLRIAGFGRISGLFQLENNRNANPNLQDQWRQFSGPTSLSSIKVPAEYHIYSGLLVLSSTAVSYGFAIEVRGITVGFGPKRNQGAVQANSAYSGTITWLGGPVDFAANAKPASFTDVKVVGNWIDASDGPEVMGPGSRLYYMYLHVNDDSIKIGAPQMVYVHATVLQGNVGGVVNIGCYGLNRGTQGSLVDNVWVHRITHNTFDHQRPSYDGYGGIVATRTCPLYTMAGGNGIAGLIDVQVRNLHVPPLGQGGNGVNSVSAMFSVSVNNPGACSWSGAQPASVFLVQGLRFSNWKVLVNPAFPGIIASFPMSGSDIRWGSPESPAVWLGSASQGRPLLESPALYPNGEQSAFGYYICGPGSPVGTVDPACLNTIGSTGPQAVSNVLYENPAAIPIHIQFPYAVTGKTLVRPDMSA